jgi:hypothetical protein
MKKFIYILIFIMLSFNISLAGEDAGSRASYTRTGWVGARYVALGKAAEVIVDDAFAIYWNPAGLCDLRGREPLSIDEIKAKARKGDVDDIKEEELVTFSEGEDRDGVAQIVASGAMLAIEREAGFAGAGFSLWGGVFGAGLYSIRSDDIVTRDADGNKTGTTAYSGNVGYLSYGKYVGNTAVGLSIKGLYEKIGEYSYSGAGADLGVQTEIIPFFKVGFVLQDIGTGLYPMDDYPDVEKEYDLGNMSMKLSAAITTRGSDFIIAFSGVKKIEQEQYEINVGMQYALSELMAIYLGLNDSFFTSGVSVTIWGTEIAYAFAYDKIDYGYNNIVSVKIAL